MGVARLLHGLGQAVCLVESQAGPQQQSQAEMLRSEGIPVHLGVPLELAALEALGPLEAVVVSPGIRWDHPTLMALRHRGVAVQGDLLPAWQASGSVPWIGITGTNGKTTVTHLLSHLLSHAGLRAPMGGNVGISAAELVLRHCLQAAEPADWLVMEMSSYQIEAADSIGPRIGIWTTLTPDHLERHGTLAAYRAIKRGLLERSQLRILNADDPDLLAHASGWRQPVQWITAGPRHALPATITPLLSISEGRVWLQRAHQSEPVELMAADCLAMPGDHNLQNLLLATAAGLEAGLSGAQIEAACRCFRGVPHRLELIREREGISWFNDSKATNYDATAVALKALAGPLVVLAGGQAKLGDGAPWVRALSRQAAAVLVYGAAREAFTELLNKGEYPGRVEGCDGLAQAVPLAAQLARELGCRAVLLSPACASFDQYTDFEQRGDHFRQLVMDL
jgi:UDP-N-acetylmuramoylalanine--D-glutamate ligase